MGLIKWYREFKERRFTKAVAKNLKIVKNPKAVREDRSAAISFFCDQKDAGVAVPSLLARFGFSLENGITDTREKEAAMAGIMKFKDDSLPYVSEYLQKSTTIAWPLKILMALSKEDQIISTLCSCLEFGDVSFDQSKVDKNYDILCYLMEYKLPQKGEEVKHFLSDHDERVRFAAVEVLLAQEEPSLVPELEPFLKDESPENTRIRRAVAAGFVKNDWSLTNKKEFTKGVFMPGFRINKKFHVETDP